MRTLWKKWFLSPETTHLKWMQDFVFNLLCSRIPGSLFTVFLNCHEFWSQDPSMRERLKNTCMVRGGIQEGICRSCYGSGRASIGRNVVSPGEKVRALEVEKIVWSCWENMEVQNNVVLQGIATTSYRWECVTGKKLGGGRVGRGCQERILERSLDQGELCFILGLMGSYCRVSFREREEQIRRSPLVVVWKADWSSPSWRMVDQLH